MFLLETYPDQIGLTIDDIFKCYKLEGISATRHVRVAKMNRSRQPDNSGGQDSSDERYIYA